MVRTLEIAEAPDATPAVAGRFEGGGTPFTAVVTPSAASPSTCFSTQADAGDPVCLDQPADGEVATAGMPLPGGPRLVGLVGPRAAGVDLTLAGGSTVTIVAVAYPGREDLAVAAPVAPADVTAVEVLTVLPR